MAFKRSPVRSWSAPPIFVSLLEEGLYTQIRLAVTSGTIVVSGVSHDLTVPSTEVKIPVDFEVMKGGATKILLDFDAEESIHVIGTGSGKSMLTPVIHVESVSF